MTSSMSPKVSVCTPVYNGSPYIAECINSVLSQTYKNFHHIVCDNCSTDNTEAIVASFHDSRLTYVRNTENIGLVGNSNRCLDLADGEYVCIFHHDDVMLPDNLEHKVQLLDEHPEVGFVHSNLIVIDGNSKVVARDIWNEDSRRDYIEDGLTAFKKYISYLPLGASFFIGSVLARRECYEKLGRFSPELIHCHDSEMWMRMLLFYDVACIGTPLVKYRVHSTTASSNWGDYTSIPFIKEHYQAVNMIFNKYKDKIHQSKSLKRQIFKSFGERALKLACSALTSGDFATGRMFFREAVRMSPWIIKSPLSWKAAGGLTIGPTGINLYQSAKKALTKQ